ncbi:hypothetical protein ABZU75_40665 [Streptosporangium sp. NPDC005286]|uniref:hypothetical protein n=1 Tax=Streptosporangium sp. NPDC005286 TaxID=3154463 RepID=UPI0033BC8066
MAAADVLGRLRALVTGAPVTPAPGSGTPAGPWRVDLVDGVELDVWRDGDFSGDPDVRLEYWLLVILRVVAGVHWSEWHSAR